MRRLLLWALGLVALGLAATAGFAVYARAVADDPAVWHVDPMGVARPGTPNHALIAPEGGDAPAPVWRATPAELMAAFDAVAMEAPRTARIGGGVDGLHATYVQRSRLMGYPDYVSVRALEASEGATLAVWSRARFGQSDLGVNRARLDRWLAAIPLPRAD